MEIETLTRIWDAFRGGTPVRELAGTDPRAALYVSALAVSRGAHAEAARLARTAARTAGTRPDSALLRAAARHLARVADEGTENVYLSPEGFAAFIRGGGNIALYAALTTALRDRYRRHRPATLLDIGAGDGTALLPALTGENAAGSTEAAGAEPRPAGHADHAGPTGPVGHVGHVDVVEPSAAMAATLAAALRRHGISHSTYNGTAHDLVAGGGPWPAERRWALGQSTFALHAVPAAERPGLLGWLAGRTDRLLIAEFDVPAHHSLEPEWFTHVVTRYERGLAEYGDDSDGLVAQGFLMPVMFGYFDPANAHHEQPVDAWAGELGAAGFARVLPPVRLLDYWWADAYLLEAASE